MRILVIEDEIRLARHILAALHRHGHEVDVRHDGPTGLAGAQDTGPDLVVLDLGLPGMDGLDVLGCLREARHPARVLVLTARGEVGDRVRGLKAGADDYLPKPFAMDELVARVEALGRRAAVHQPGDTLRVADLQMNLPHRRVVRAGRNIPLSPREFELLEVLVQEPGRVFSRTELCARVWQRDHEYDTRTVEIFIARLRRKIDAGANRPLIETHRSIGYAVRPDP